MGETVEKNINGDVIRVTNEPGCLSLDTEYLPLEFSVERARQKYLRDKQAYFETPADDPAIERKTKKWQQSAYQYMRWAGTLFNVSREDPEKRQKALDIMDTITKDASLRYQNICKHGDHMVEHADEDKKNSTQDEMDEAEYSAASFMRNAVCTQDRFQELFKKNGTYEASEFQKNVEASAFMAELREKVFPRDHIYLPGRIIPPYTVPRNERVPYKPDPYELAKNQPVEAYEFDRELDEVVIKKGYVSEDGLIDDESIKYDMENMTCTMKYRGGVPVTWNLWKAKDTFDVPAPDSWVTEYVIRSYRQRQEDQALGILKHRREDDEIPPYNVKPIVRC